MSISFNSEYDSEIVAIFLEEIDGYLPELEESLGKLHANAKDKDALEVAHRLAHTIKGTAASLGFNDVSKQGQVLEQVLTPVFEKKAQLTPQSLDDCDSHLTVLKMMLAQMHIAASGDSAVVEPEPATPAVSQPPVFSPPQPQAPAEPVAPFSLHTQPNPADNAPAEFNLFDDLPPFAFSGSESPASNEPAPFTLPIAETHNVFSTQPQTFNHNPEFNPLDDFFSTSLPDLPEIAEEHAIPETASPFDDFFSKVESPTQISEDLPDWLISHNKPSTNEDLPDWLKESAASAPMASDNVATPASGQEEQLPNWLNDNSFAHASQPTPESLNQAAPNSEQLLDFFIEDIAAAPSAQEGLPDWFNDVPANTTLQEKLPEEFSASALTPVAASESLPDWLAETPSAPESLPDWLESAPASESTPPEQNATSVAHPDLGPVVWDNLPSQPSVAATNPTVSEKPSVQSSAFDADLNFFDDVFDAPPPLIAHAGSSLPANVDEAVQPKSSEAFEFYLEVPAEKPEAKADLPVETPVAIDEAVASELPDLPELEAAKPAEAVAENSLPDLPELEVATPTVTDESSLKVPSLSPKADVAVASETQVTPTDESVVSIPLEVPAVSLQVPPTDTVVAEVPAELPLEAEVPVSEVYSDAQAIPVEQQASRSWADEALELFSFEPDASPFFAQPSPTAAQEQIHEEPTIIADANTEELPSWLVENNPLFVEPSPTLSNFALPVQPEVTAAESQPAATTSGNVTPTADVAENTSQATEPAVANSPSYSLFEIDAHHAPADVTSEDNLELPPLDDLFDFEEFPFSPPAVQTPTASAAAPSWDNLDDFFSTSAIDQHIDRLQQQILPEIPSNPAEFEAVPLPSEIAVSDSDLLARLTPPVSIESDFPAINQDTGRSEGSLNDNSLPDLAEVEALLDILEPMPQMGSSSPDFSDQFFAAPATGETSNLDGLPDLSNFDPLLPDIASEHAAAVEVSHFSATEATPTDDEVAAALQPLEEVADEPQVLEAATAVLPEVDTAIENAQPEHSEDEFAEAGFVPTTHHEDSAAIAAALSGKTNLPAGIEGLTEEELAMAMESGFDFSEFADDDSGFGFDAAPMWLAEAQADIDRLQSILDGDAPLESSAKIRDIAATLRKGAELMELTEITNQLSVIETMVGMVISGDLPNSPNTLIMVKNAYADFIKLVEPYQEAARAILNPEPLVAASSEFEEKSASAAATPAPLPALVAQPPTGVEVDRELAETFAEEAEEHIQNLDVRLAALEKDPNNRELIREIRRTAHTLKGSAAMVGFHVVSQTGHLMEDLLDRLFDGSLEVSEPIIELLFATFNAMDNMVRSLRAGRPEDYSLLSALRPRYDAVLEAESQAGEEAGGAIIFERKGTAALSPDVADAAAQAPIEIAATDSGVATAFDAELAVRVPIGRLDGMMNQVGEMVINRTVLEQRNQVFDRAVEELKLSINRLQRISRDLETRYEVELLKNSSVMTPGVPVGAGSGGGRGRGSDSYLGYGGSSDPISTIGSEFDTLEMDRYTEFHTLSREMSETVSDIAAVQRELDNLRDDLDNISVQQSRLTDDLQDRLVKVRLVPLSNLTPRLYRTVRTVAAQQGKDIEFVVSGDSTQVDKTIFEEIADPLLHLVRNAVDHGIEPNQERATKGKKPSATVGFAARTEGSEVVIEVSDDGYGIDLTALKQRGIERGFMAADADPTDEEIYNLMFLPGFSTSQTISEISGRGVGLDVVKANVTRLKGIIEVASQADKGTTFSIRIPNTLAISRAMLVQAGGYTYAVPLNVVEETTRLEQQAVIPGSEKYGRGSYYRYNGETMPLYELNSLLHLPAHSRKLAELQADDDELNSRRERPLLIITGAQRYALLIDTLVGQQEVVVKPLGNHLKSARGVVGATILGNGQVTLILNVYELVTMDKNQRQLVGGKVGGIRTGGQVTDLGAARALSEAEVRERELSALRNSDTTDKQVSAKVRRTPIIQVVDDSLSIRKVLSGALEKAGFRVRTSKDGQEALEIIQQNSPDLIIMDIEMPRMDGYQLTSILKSDPSYQPIPIVMLTSRAGLKHRQKAEEVGADGFLVKPYKEEELLGIVSELLIRAGS